MRRFSIAVLITAVTTACGARTATAPAQSSSTPIVATASADVSTGVAPLPVHFRASAAGGEGTLELSWDFGDGTTGNGAEIDHVFGGVGDFVATVTATDRRTTATASIAIHVGQASEADLVVDSVDVQPSSNGDRYEPNDSQAAYVGGPGYVWVIDDATIAPTDLQVHAVIRNVGAETKSDFDVGLYTSDPSSASPDVVSRVSALAANEATGVDFTIPAVSAGIHDTWIGADVANVIPEADETNDLSADNAVETAADVDYYAVTENAGKTIEVSLSGLPADYDVALYDAFGNQLGVSDNAGTASEDIRYTTTSSGLYVVKVWGSFGASDAFDPYHLEITVP